MTTFTTPPRATFRDHAGFTLVELLVATVVSMLVLGGAVILTAQVQAGYRRQVEDAVAIQEGRFALEWVGRLVRGAGNNPFNRTVTVCPTNPTAIQAIRFDPNADTINNDIRLQADSNPPDGLFGGDAIAGCTQANEDVTVSFDAANNVIVFLDNNLGGAAAVRTDRVIQNLQFVYRDVDDNVTTFAADVVFVEIRVTVRTRTLDPSTSAPVTRTLSSKIRVRSR